MRLQVEALEHDKHVITNAFERVLASLQASLSMWVADALEFSHSACCLDGARPRGPQLVPPPLALLQGDLADVKGRLEALRRERDG